jgi:hypothetical protein
MKSNPRFGSSRRERNAIRTRKLILSNLVPSSSEKEEHTESDRRWRKAWEKDDRWSKQANGGEEERKEEGRANDDDNEL